MFFKADDLAALRAKVTRPPCKAVYDELRKQADAGRAKWAGDKERLRLAELVGRLPDLTMEFVPAEHAPPGAREAGRALEEHAVHGAPAAAFVYLLTGERDHAAYAWEVFELCARAGRWGWFPWAGSHMPQIHFGIVSRNLVLVADCVWDALTPDQRRRARDVIAEKCVEPYFRLVLHTPGMGLYHLRSKNQGNNALAAALIGSLFVGDSVRENAVWQSSLLQTFHWLVTHDIGWMGQGLESGIGGYWSVSVQNLYTAAAALANVTGIDLRGHPGFEQATLYPLVHEATVPGVGTFAEPIDPRAAGAAAGVLGGKPIELPGSGRPVCGPWWFDFAARHPGSAAGYFIHKGMAAADRLSFAECHQGPLARVLALAWWSDDLLRPAAAPRELSLFTDRMANLRGGWGVGPTSLYFNGDVFLSAKKEILGCTSGMSWHFPWHQYQVTESGVETEGELYAPSMVIDQAGDDGRCAFFRAHAGPSNVAYYPLKGQRESYKHFTKRTRTVAYVRGGERRADYFLFHDAVSQPGPRWHGWTWHLWDPVAGGKNRGRFVPQGDRAVRGERPNADLWIEFLTPDRLGFERHGIPSQPSVAYVMDHNAQMLRAVAGAYRPADAAPVVLPPSAWKDLGSADGDTLHVPKPPTDRPVTSAVVGGLNGGVRYRWSVECKEQDYRAYEATAWAIDLELLDAAGTVLARPTTPYGHPHPLRLGAPASDLPTHDWIETAQYFDAPQGTVACRAVFRAVGGAHYFKLGQLWLRPIELRPLGVPHRAAEQEFLALVVPLDKGAPPPKLTHAAGGKALLHHADGSADEIALAGDTLTVTRRQGADATPLFPPAPGAGAGRLTTNSDASARELAAGLAPLRRKIEAERDALVARGRKNLAAGARVSASATRDRRFGPENVVDNRTAEYPPDGRLDYTLGTVESSGRFVGYGAGRESLLADRDRWPLYVKPTWWLLPEQTPGHVELELARPATVGLVRLLNTSNAGLNDFAATTFRVELYDRDRRKLASRDGAFGTAFDRPFRQAFVVPKWFDRYTPSFAGMLEPGVRVPFGDGWQEVRFDAVADVAFVRVAVTGYWALGGGLNEVQVYGP